MPRTPHRSGPSGQHRRVEGPALAQQRAQMRADVLAALDPGERLCALLLAPGALSEPLPHGHVARIGLLLGLPPTSAMETARKMWAGERVYRRRAKIF